MMEIVQKTVQKHLRGNFPYRHSVPAEHLLEEIINGKCFGCTQCHIKVLEILRANFENFPPIFMNISFSKNNFGDLMETYA